MEFCRQEYGSGVPCPPPSVLHSPGIKPVSPALVGGFFTAKPPGKPPECNTLSPINDKLLALNHHPSYVAVFPDLSIWDFHESLS